MNVFDKIEALALKKKAMESVLSDGANTEIIAERLILLLNGDINLLDYMLSGVPYELKDPANRLELEKYIREKLHIRLEVLNEVIVRSTEVEVHGHATSRVWLKPENEDGARRIQSGSPVYNEDIKYSQTSEYSKACDHPIVYSERILLKDLIEFGIEFKRL